MPLSKIGDRVLREFIKRYGAAKGKSTFYAAMNNGTIDATKMEHKGGSIRKRQAKEKKEP